MDSPSPSPAQSTTTTPAHTPPPLSPHPLGEDGPPPQSSWPDPAAGTTTTTTVLSSLKPRARVLSNKPRARSIRSPKQTKFEVGLVEHLAEFLEGSGGQSIKSIESATGVRTELIGKTGERRFSCTGSASAVAKARQLVDARLSQTPIRIYLSIRLHSEASSLKLIHASLPMLINSDPASSSFHIVESAPLTPRSPGSTVPPYLRPFADLSPQSPINESPPRPTPPVDTPGSEKSDSSFFSPSRTTSRSASVVGDNKGHLPTVGSFIANKESYINAVIDELETCVERSSLVKLKLAAGSQLFNLTGDVALAAKDGAKVTLDEVSRWKIDGTHRNLQPYFSVALSREKADEFKALLVSDTIGLQLSRETSQVHITHLDRARAVYACATSDLKGGEIKNHKDGVGTSGALMLKKCSTLPSKPFFLSVTNPTSESDPLAEASDLRMKVLTDKAATSPSSELSLAIQGASWVLDAHGYFEVNVAMDPKRFTENETAIRWCAKSRYENEDFRVTVCEVRIAGSKKLWYEVECTYKRMNRRLADLVQARNGIDREEMYELVERFLDWGMDLLQQVRSVSKDEKRAAEEVASDRQEERFMARVC